MRWWPRRRQARLPVEAERAKLQAEQHLAEVRQQYGEIEEITGKLARHLEENHLAEAIVASMSRRRRGRFRHL